jgi:hypothetical protein
LEGVWEVGEVVWRGVSGEGAFIAGWGSVGGGHGQWHGVVTTPNGEHGASSTRKGGPREQASRGGGCQDIIMAQSWERTRPAALCPRWGVHGKKKKKEGGS